MVGEVRWRQIWSARGRCPLQLRCGGVGVTSHSNVLSASRPTWSFNPPGTWHLVPAPTWSFNPPGTWHLVPAPTLAFKPPCTRHLVPAPTLAFNPPGTSHFGPHTHLALQSTMLLMPATFQASWAPQPAALATVSWPLATLRLFPTRRRRSRTWLRWWWHVALPR